jgi:hypothetical protein
MTLQFFDGHEFIPSGVEPVGSRSLAWLIQFYQATQQVMEMPRSCDSG